MQNETCNISVVANKTAGEEFYQLPLVAFSILVSQCN